MNLELSLKLTIDNQSKIIEEQSKVIMDKREKEKEIAMELTTRIREALALGSPKLKTYTDAMQNKTSAPVTHVSRTDNAQNIPQDNRQGRV